MTAYQTRGTADPAAYEALLRANWFYADDLRMRFFEDLSRTHKLDAELAALEESTTPQQVNANPAAARMLADGEAWRAHFEEAAPVYRAITVSYPATSPTERAATVYRSLQQTEVAATIEQNLVAYAPGDTNPHLRRRDLRRSRPFRSCPAVWNRIANITPGRAEGYLESATVFWDYFLFDDALRTIAEGRRKLEQSGAVCISGRRHLREQAPVRSRVGRIRIRRLSESGDLAQRRLVRLARRPSLRDDVERLTADLANRPDPSLRALELRAAVLENQGRRSDLEQFLRPPRTTSLDTV